MGFEAQLGRQLVERDVAQQVANRLGTHARAEHASCVVLQSSEIHLGQGVARLDAFQPLDTFCGTGLQRLIATGLADDLLRLLLNLVTQLVNLRVVLRRDLLLLGVGVRLEPIDVLLDRVDQCATRVRSDAVALAGDRYLRRLERDVGVEHLAVELLELGLDLGCALGRLGRALLLARFERLQALGLLSLEPLELAIQIARELLDLLLVGALLATDLGLQVLLDGTDQARALVFVHVDDDVFGEVEDLLERARSHVEQQADAAGRALHEPDVRHRRSQLDVAHALATHLGARDLDAALVADDALVAHALVLAAGALPVLLRSKHALAEQAATPGLKRGAVAGCGLGPFATRPRPDLIRRGEGDPYRVEVIYFQHPVSFVSFVRAFSRSRVRAFKSVGPRTRQRANAPTRERLLNFPSLEPRAVDVQRANVASINVFGKCHFLFLFVQHFNRQSETLKLLDEHLERLGHARLEDIFALDNRFVGLDTTHHVVGLDRQDLLQRVRRAVRLERPHLHLAEALAAELRLTTQRLLRDERVRPRRAGVDLVLDQVDQLEHIDVADRHLLVERLAGAPVAQSDLARLGQTGSLQLVADVRFCGAVEDGCGELDADLIRGPTEVGLQDLTDVHAARHAEWIRMMSTGRPSGRNGM